MKVKATTHYWLTVLMLFLALLLAISAFMLWVILPLGYLPARLLWGEIHKWTGLSMTMVPSPLRQ